MDNIDDLLGDVDDLLGPAPRKTRRKARKPNAKTYKPLDTPKTPLPNGIFALKEAKGRNLGRTCLICKKELKHKRGRPPVVCGKQECFRAYRNAYRLEYDRARASA